MTDPLIDWMELYHEHETATLSVLVVIGVFVLFLAAALLN